jgi:hypothetical protein
MKGIATLLEAFAKLRTERDVELVAGRAAAARRPNEQMVDRLGNRRPRAGFVPRVS